MEKISFILNSGLESLKQSINHYNKFNQFKELSDLRFSLMHLDCAFELVIKEFIKGQDRILFERDGKSLKLTDCVKSLHRVEGQIINVNDVLILHQMRNNAQHLGILPAEDHALEVIEKVLVSIHSFLKVNFNIELHELSRILFNRFKEKKEGYEYYLDVSESAINSGQFEIALIAKYIALEGIIKLIIDTKRPMTLLQIINRMNTEYNLFETAQVEKIRGLTRIKNDLMHELTEFETDILIEANEELNGLIKSSLEKLVKNKEENL